MTTSASAPQPFSLELRVGLLREHDVRHATLGALGERALRGRECPSIAFGAELRWLVVEGCSSSIEGIVALTDRVTTTGQTVAAVLGNFLGGDSGSQGDALGLGRYLTDHLLAPADTAQQALWRDALSRSGDRGVRLEIVAEHGVLRELPFELCADGRGFFLHGDRGPHFALRTPRREVARIDAHLPRGARVVAAWASPKGNTIDPNALRDHQDQVTAAAQSAGFQVDPLPAASASRLRGALSLERPAGVLSLLAHGAPEGGRVMLHDDRDPAYPEDARASVDPDGIADPCRAAGVKLGALWSCHAGRHHPELGALATRLLLPEGGALAAVVTSHAALLASSTAYMAARLFDKLSLVDDDVERALTAARRELSSDDLQWAAPVYYARPRDGRGVLAELPPPPPRASSAARALRPLPRRAPCFLGRTVEIEAALTALRSHSVVSVTGMVGAGKTELAKAVAERIVDDAAAGFEALLWVNAEHLRTDEALLAQIGRDLGLPPDEAMERAAIARAIGARKLLLVLDNTETLIDAAPEETRTLVAALLDACEGLRVLSASQTAFGSSALGEHDLLLDCLPPDVARSLFLAAAGPHVAEAERGSLAINRILAWADGHARSLVRLASQIGVGDPALTPEAVADRLDASGTRAVVMGDQIGRAPPERRKLAGNHRRLDVGFEQAWEAMERSGTPAASMATGLALWPAGLPRRMLTAVFGPEAEDGRAFLLRRRIAEQPNDRNERLILPGPMRAFAAGKLALRDSTERGALLATSLGVLAVVMHLAHEGAQRGEVRQAHEIALAEHANVLALTAALAAWAETAGDAELDAVAEPGARCLGPFVELMVVASMVHTLQDAMARLQRAIARLHGCPRATLERTLGDLAMRTDRLDEAERHYQAALPIFTDIQDRLGEANMLDSLGDLFLARGRPIESFNHTLRGLAAHLSIQNALGVAGAHVRMARACSSAGHSARAIALHGRALAQYAVLQDAYSQAVTPLELAGDFQTVGHEELFVAALAASIPFAVAGAHPIASQLAPVAQELTTMQMQEALQDVLAAVAHAEAELRDQGIDPLSPLEV